MFAEPLDLVPMPRRTTGEAAFDSRVRFVLGDAEDMSRITPSLRKLVLGWRVPLHSSFEKAASSFRRPLCARILLRWRGSPNPRSFFADKAAKL